MNKGEYERENIFGTPQYDFYDEIVCNDAKKDLSRIFLGLFIFNVIAYAVTFAVDLAIMLTCGAEAANELFSNAYFNMIMGVLPMYTVALPVFYLMIRKIPSRKPEKQDFGFLSFIALIPVSLFFMTVGNYVSIFLVSILELFKGSEITNATSAIIEDSPLWLIFLFVVVIGPIVEEFIFRKLMIEKISRYGYTAAIIISSVAFGIFHGNFYQFFYSTLIGFVLGYIFVKSGNWLYSVLMHMLLNLYGSIGSIKISELLQKFWELLTAYTENQPVDTNELTRCYSLTMLISFSIVALTVMGAIIFFRAVIRKNIIICDGEAMTIPKGKRAKTVFLNTGVILFLISTALITFLSLL